MQSLSWGKCRTKMIPPISDTPVKTHVVKKETILIVLVVLRRRHEILMVTLGRPKRVVSLKCTPAKI